MPIYSCEKCDQEFKQKSDYTRHINKKYPCVTQEQLATKIEKVTDFIKQKVVDKTENINLKDLENDLAELAKTTNPSKKDIKGDTENIISNKEALKDKIHEIHNFLRNNGAGYGMNALKVFNILYGLKKIEENKLLDKIKLKKPDCKFSHLLSLANENKDEELTELIYGSILDSIHGSEIRDLLFYEIPKNIKSSTFTYLIKEINKITEIEKKCNVLLSGKIYEYFIGRDETAISELGAYFTDRHIVDYIYKKIEPILNEDSTIKSMCDMFGGSGGFTTGYINYLIKTYPNKINWQTEIKKVNHFDMNEDVIKSAGLEFFCLTGEIPDMMKNLKYKNSFNDEFNHNNYDLVITNPPYGGDKQNQTDSQLKRDKVKNYIKEELKELADTEIINHRKKQLKIIEELEKQEKKECDKTKVSLSMCSNRVNKFAVKHKLSGNDKEACSLILMMDLLEKNGICAGVLKEGVFFNKTYKDLRKCLINNFNVTKVISVPKDQFENTTVKTSIVIFDSKTTKTQQVEFYDLNVERYEEDKFEVINNMVILTENKGDIKEVSDILVSKATLEELNENPIHSLNSKDYNKTEIICGEDYELKKLGDLCNCLPTTKHYTNIGKTEGEYRFYCSSQEKKLYVDFCEIEKYSIILGQGGHFNIHFDKNFTPSKHVCVLQTKNENIDLLKFCYYLIPELQKTFITNGSTISWLNKTNIKDLNVPVPKTPEKMKYWVDKISKQHNILTTKKQKIEDLETQVKNKIQEIINDEECEEVEMSELCEIKSGKAINSENRTGNTYPYYAANGISGYVDEYLFDGEYIICAQDGSIGATHKVNGKFYASNHVWVLKNNNTNINYIYNILKYFVDYNKITSGSVIPKMTKDKLAKLKIQIPKNKNLIKDLEPAFAKIEKIQDEVKTADKLYNQYIKELSEEAIPKKTDSIDDNLTTSSTSSVKKTKTVIIDDSDDTPKVKSTKKSIKKTN
jgi:type I restriction-modification system DNA methylase subunit